MTRGMVRLTTLSLFVVGVGMIRVQLSHHGAWLVVAVGGALIVAAAAVMLGFTRRLEERLAIRGAGELFLLALRRTGLPLLGLTFFLAWTLVYVALWAERPEGAFRGLPASPHFADFFYYAVTTALLSPPGDLIAHSRGARSATMIEMLTAFALLSAYLSSFVDWRRAKLE